MLAVVLAACLSAPNVVLISVDTLRADYLGCYGFAHATSPNIDALAAAGLVFEDVICEIPLTGPSFCSMFSSRFPRVTGATRNALPLSDDVPTVTQSFQEAGYHTVAIQSNWTLKRDLSNLHRGFDLYEDDFHKKRWGFMISERDAKEVTRLALEALSAWDQAKPLFAWFHYSDPHAPYQLHRGFNVAKDLESEDGRAENVRKKYSSEIAYSDDQIGRVLDALPNENTYVVFLSDHGESLYEHDYLGHGRRIYQDGLRIPLVIRGPGIDAGRTDRPVRGIDIGPTLLGLAGLAPKEGMSGIDVLHAEIPIDRARVVETYGGAVLRIPGIRSVMAGARPQLRGVVVAGWKLVLEGDRTELYYLADDRDELRNRAGAEPGKVDELRALIDVWDSETARMKDEAARLNQDDVEALKSLGYVE